MKTLTLETTAPFQGLAELVAYNEGLFEKEGLLIKWADRERGVDKRPQLDVTDVTGKGVNRYASHGKLLEEGKADLYNACEWGNYCRVESTKVGSRQIGRRSIVTFAALVVRGDSPVQTPQQFANRQIGVPFFFGTHYLTLQMLEGFVPREMIKLGRVPNGSPYRFKLLMDGEIEATTLTEPYISLAEKKGCRLIISAFHHGTEVASDRVDAETYSAFNRAVREAVRRISANKRAYLHYFIDYYKDKDPEIAKLTIDDLRESRVYVVDPAPIPVDELQRTYEWMKSWGFLDETPSPLDLINPVVQQQGYAKSQSAAVQ
jgi:NitT/TauT family transport system substrate-binding protein